MHLILKFVCCLLSQLFSFITQNLFMNQNHLESLLCTNSWVLCPEVLIQFVMVVVQYFLFLTSSLKMLRMTHLFWKCISRTIDLLYCMEYFHIILWTNPFKLRCWRRLTKVPWTARKSNQSILREIKPWIFIGRTDAGGEFPLLWPPDEKSWLTRKDPDAGKNRRQKEKGVTEDEMVR